jgi:hypothetical protein
MAEMELKAETALQRQIARMALELAAKLEAEVGQAPAGRVVTACEDVLLDRGRQFLRDALAASLQARIDEDEKKGARPVPVPADRPAATRARGAASSSAP